MANIQGGGGGYSSVVKKPVIKPIDYSQGYSPGPGQKAYVPKQTNTGIDWLSVIKGLQTPTPQPTVPNYFSGSPLQQFQPQSQQFTPAPQLQPQQQIQQPQPLIDPFGMNKFTGEKAPFTPAPNLYAQAIQPPQPTTPIDPFGGRGLLDQFNQPQGPQPQPAPTGINWLDGLKRLTNPQPEPVYPFRDPGYEPDAYKRITKGMLIKPPDWGGPPATLLNTGHSFPNASDRYKQQMNWFISPPDTGPGRSFADLSLKNSPLYLLSGAKDTKKTIAPKTTYPSGGGGYGGGGGGYEQTTYPSGGGYDSYGGMPKWFLDMINWRI